MLERTELARLVDHTLLSPTATAAYVEALAAEAADGLRAFPPSDAREALVGLCAYVVARKR